MNLVPLSVDSIQFGHPLPFVLRGADGALLAQKGFVIRNREDLNLMLSRGVQLCVDTDESGESHRAYLAGLQRMLIADTNLGEIASMKISAAEPTSICNPTTVIRFPPDDAPRSASVATVANASQGSQRRLTG